jgi:hypothetical protein
MEQEDVDSEGVFEGAPFEDSVLKRLVSILRDLRRDDHEPPESIDVDGLPQPLAGLIIDAAYRFRTESTFPIEVDPSEEHEVRKELDTFRRSIKRSPDDPVSGLAICSLLASSA